MLDKYKEEIISIRTDIAAKLPELYGKLCDTFGVISVESESTPESILFGEYHALASKIVMHLSDSICSLKDIISRASQIGLSHVVTNKYYLGMYNSNIAVSAYPSVPFIYVVCYVRLSGKIDGTQDSVNNAYFDFLLNNGMITVDGVIKRDDPPVQKESGGIVKNDIYGNI